MFVIRVPEPEVINSHPHLEILHETNIKSVQRESSQTEKGGFLFCDVSIQSKMTRYEWLSVWNKYHFN